MEQRVSLKFHSPETIAVWRNIVAGGSVCLMLAGCVSPNDVMSNGPGPHRAQKTAVQKAIGECVMSVAGGAVLGAILGGSRHSNSGALLGAAVGAGACAVLIEVASREDQKRIVDAQRAAVRTNRSRTTAFKTKSGKRAVVRTRIHAAPVPKTASTAAKPKFTNCRYASQQISVDGKASNTPRQLWCRVPTGDWQPYDMN